VEAALRATKKKMKEAAFNGSRSVFFNTIDTLERRRLQQDFSQRHMSLLLTEECAGVAIPEYLLGIERRYSQTK
jgi:hypothetical protein